MNGSIAWFARHRVAANILALLILVGGLITVLNVTQEVFPEFSLDLITVSVRYLGAAPGEVEEGVCVRIEEAIQGLDGVKRVTSVASEGIGVVNVELIESSDSRKVLDDVKSRIDAIDTFPELTEKPVITEVTNRRQVIDVAVYGDADEKTLRHIAEQIRDELPTLPGVTLTQLANAAPYEISIEVAENTLRRHGLTFDQVAAAVRRSSLDLPGGSVKTEGGEVLLRTKGQAYHGREFEDLVLLTRPDGTRLTLGEAAVIRDGFEDTDQITRFDGKPAMAIQVYRVGQQNAPDISDQVTAYVEQAQLRMPEGVYITTWNDASKVLRGRRDLLIRNGLWGVGLIFLTLALFLRFRLALWVAFGMALSFFGALWLMPALGITINLITLFAFILVLGIVVDDAIVVGERIHRCQHESGDGPGGAIQGAREVARPVVFAVLTTVAAFLPLLNVAGTTGKIMRVIPLIVIPCLLWSLVESLWILPAHLSHYKHHKKQRGGMAGLWRRFQTGFAGGLDGVIEHLYQPSLEFALRWRYLTLALGVSTLLITAGLFSGGYIGWVFFPQVEADFISAAVTMPPGTPAEATSAAVAQLERAAGQVREEIRERTGQDPYQHSFSAIGEQPFSRAQRQNAGGATSRELASHLGEMTIELLPAEERTSSSEALAERWRELTGPIPDALEVRYTSSLFSPGEDINVQLTGPDIDRLSAAASALKERIGEYSGTYEISDSFRAGKREIKLEIQPRAELLGLTLADLGRQVRQAFYGEEAQRVQRGRDDLRVMVRYPESERRSVGDLENMRIRTPDGGEVPFSEVATVASGRGYAAITRVDRRRAINVTADVDPAQAVSGDIIAELDSTVLPELLLDYPGVKYTFEGQQAEQRDTLGGLMRGGLVALVMIYGLLAVPLRSYIQPVVIMAAIPFGIVGALWGHAIMGMDVTILSMFGLVALTGVVVNDSLVMVDFINRHCETHDERVAAVKQAGALRFRPILLTSLTTFMGLAPLMLEKSMQARFLIPMAVSLAFGVIFATFITLILVPAGYMALEDLTEAIGRIRSRLFGEPAAAPPDPQEPELGLTPSER